MIFAILFFLHIVNCYPTKESILENQIKNMYSKLSNLDSETSNKVEELEHKMATIESKFYNNT